MQNFAKLLRSKIEARDPAFLKYETGNLLIELIFLFILKMYFLVIQILMLAGAGGGTTALSSSSISSAPSASCDVSASHSAILSVSKPVVASQVIPIAQKQTVEHTKDGIFNYLFLFRLYAE
jgi:guanyl-specific ribonuclease Sa